MKKITIESSMAAAQEKEKTNPLNSKRRVVLDRRAKNSDRRQNPVNQDYHGPFRRHTVDRREIIKDRRDN
jgi:hypothetical protein